MFSNHVCKIITLPTLVIRIPNLEIFLFFQHYIIHWKFKIVTNYILIVWKYFIFVVSMEITKKNQSYVVIEVFSYLVAETKD
jgi:hypothetical protein